jgi:hypothetical protein
LGDGSTTLTFSYPGIPTEKEPENAAGVRTGLLHEKIAFFSMA